MRGGALQHGHIRVVLPQRGTDIVSGIVGAHHDHLLATIGIRPRVLAGVLLLTFEGFGPRKVRHIGHARHARGQHQLLGPQGHGLAVAYHLDHPLAARLIELSTLTGRGVPVIELHDLGIHLQPVRDLVLGREHRPVCREGDVRHVVVPHRIMQTQGLVAIAPGIARTRILVDHDGWHIHLSEPRGQPDAALTATDDHAIRLALVAQLGLFALTRLKPGLTLLVGTMLGALGALHAQRLGKFLEFAHGGQQRPAAPFLQAQQALAACIGGLEGEPGLDDAAGLTGLAIQLPARGSDMLEGRREHRLDLVLALRRLEIPGEGDQIAPVAFLAKQRENPGDIALSQGGLEIIEPLLSDLSWRACGHGVSPRVVGCCSHAFHPRHQACQLRHARLTKLVSTCRE